MHSPLWWKKRQVTRQREQMWRGGGPEARGALSHADVSVLRLLLHENSTGQNLPTRLALHLLCSPRELQPLEQGPGQSRHSANTCQKTQQLPQPPYTVVWSHRAQKSQSDPSPALTLQRGLTIPSLSPW